jgi:hypothetical protein
MELLSGHEKIITKSRISLNEETSNRGFTVCCNEFGFTKKSIRLRLHDIIKFEIQLATFSYIAVCRLNKMFHLPHHIIPVRLHHYAGQMNAV